MSSSIQAATRFSNPEIIRIDPDRSFWNLGLWELWRHRELVYFLIWRDVKVRYKQTALGAGWAIIQPFFQMVVFTIFFGRLARVPSDDLPYPIFAYCGLLAWTYFSQSLNQASSSLVRNANMIQKVYFPRLAVPVSGSLAGLVDLAVAFSVLLVLMAHYGIHPRMEVLLLPVFLTLAIITSLGAGIWMSALNVRYRDVNYAVPFLIQFWLFVTPVVYPSSLLSGDWRTVYGINPMVGVVEGFRWALLGTDPPGPMIGVSALVAVLVLISGVFYFRATEKSFADIV